MRAAIMLLAMIVAMAAVPGIAHAGQGKAKVCSYKTADLGTITGRGPTEAAAFEDAATKCFDRRAHLYKAKHDQTVDDDAGLAIIDVCANLKCS